MENAQENLTIGAFAKAAGVNVETIRFYQRNGFAQTGEEFNSSGRLILDMLWRPDAPAASVEGS